MLNSGIAMRESDLYAPLKAYLEAQGYEVKAEIGDCDLMACREGDPPIIVEMKLTFSLALLMQGVDRQKMFDCVYLAVPVSSARGWKLRYDAIIHTCRRLGLGLLAVRAGDKPRVTAHLDPGPYQPRKSARRSGRLLKEFAHRVGDPNVGGVNRVKRVTAYRQDAIRCATHLAAEGPTKAADVAKATGVQRAGVMMRADHYGWFERVTRGVYGLTPRGEAELADYADVAQSLKADA